MSSYEVEAFIYGKKIGTILLKNGTVYFEYDRGFRDSNLEISPLKLPLSMSGIYTNSDDRYFEGLAGVFHDSLPDKFGTKVIERFFESKNIPTSELNVIQKLMFVSGKSIGAISYKPLLYDKQNGVTDELIELNQFYANAKKIVQGDRIEVIDEMLTFMDSAASAGGARAKAIIGYDKQSKQIISGTKDTLPVNYEHYIIKFDMPQYNGSSGDFISLEYLYMTMAKEVGINIPEMELLTHDNLKHYLIKRFDRVDGRAVHMHSVAGLTHANFNVPMHYSYDELLRLTRYLTGDQRSVNEIYKRMVFNIVSRNQDDHAKKFSFMMDNVGKWTLSPAYDITYANGTGFIQNHQLSLLGKTSDFRREDLLQIAKLHSLKLRDANDTIDEIIEHFSTFKARALELELDKKFVDKVFGSLRLEL